MKLLTQNKKMVKTNKANNVTVWNFGITAKKSCPNADKCLIGCYADQGAYVWPNVRQAFDRRLDLTRTDEFTPMMIKEIKGKRNITHVRIHDSGDFYNIKYIAKWIDIIKQFPNIQFYAYTKMVKTFKDLTQLNQIPHNFTLIYSFGGKQDNDINVLQDRHSQVFDNAEQLAAAGYIDASNDDLLAINTPNNMIGLTYHGSKAKKWGKQ